MTDTAVLTTKLSYRNDDRAMRPTYGCPENFRESLTPPAATFPDIFNRLFSDRSYECAYKIKFAALPVPEIIGGTPKLGSPWIRPSSPKFLLGFCSGVLCECIGQI